jgi:hypothetical protein
MIFTLLGAVPTRVFCSRFSVRDGAAAQLLPLIFSRDHARDRARKAMGAVGRRRHHGRRNVSKKREWKRPLTRKANKKNFFTQLITRNWFNIKYAICITIQPTKSYYISCGHIKLIILRKNLLLREKKDLWSTIIHGRSTEEGRRTGFLLLRSGCQLRARALKHSSIWRNLKCLLYRYWKSKISGFRIRCRLYVIRTLYVVRYTFYMSTKFKGAHDIFVIFFSLNMDTKLQML